MIVNKQKERLFQFLLGVFFTVICISFIVPFWMIISVSFTNEVDVVNYGYRIIPVNIDLSAYEYLIKDYMTIVNAYKVTIITSFSGTFLHLLFTSMCAFALSRFDFRYRSQITFYMFFTMLFSGGLVPSYILMTQYLQLKDTYWALIIPIVGNVWNLFLMRTFFQQIPFSIVESAKIDGAGDFRIYLQLILPLSTPALATIGLMQLLNGWNSWYSALLYINSSDLYPLQYLLQVMLRNIQEITSNMMNNPNLSMEATDLPTESLRMAMCIVAIGPMLMVFPFFQKYFTKGLTVGSVKG